MLSTDPHRVCLENTLALIADRQAQLDYQARAPGLDVSTELFLQWEDCYRPRAAWFGAAFDGAEAEALRAFHAVFRGVRDEVLFSPPPIAAFVNTAAWRRYRDAADAALEHLRTARRAA